MAGCENDLQILRQSLQEGRTNIIPSFALHSPPSRTPNHPLTTVSKQKKTSKEVEMGESIGPASGLSCKMPFIVSSNIDKVDPVTRKLIRRHVMRGKKKKKADKPGVAGLVSAGSIQNHRTQITLQELLEMYTLLQASCLAHLDTSSTFPTRWNPQFFGRWNKVRGVPSWL